MLAYLAMMAPRLVELRRVLKSTGSIYLHCDPTASHYLKLIMDAVFGVENFRNEIIWKRSHAHSDTKQGARHFGRVTDTLLFYSKSDASIWNQHHLPYDQEYIDRDYRRIDDDGRRYRIDNLQGPGGAAKGNPSYEVMGVTRHWRYSKEKMAALIEAGRVIQTRLGAVPQYKRYLDEMPGVPVQSLWDDLPPLNNRAKESLGYPTQKPEALLDRILRASSNEGDLVLDPFCGCGTTVQVAERLKRRWIGIDITHLAISLIKKRLADSYGIENRNTYKVFGEPRDLQSARQLAQDDRFGFENWALGMVYARKSEQKKGADSGVDGRKLFHDDRSNETRQMLLSVKSGHVDVTMIRDLRGAMEREKAEFGIFITLEPPSKPMIKEAVEAGFYKSPLGGNYPRIQILTIQQLFDGATIDYKELTDRTLRTAPRHRPAAETNLSLNLEPNTDFEE
jgi:DNA modification methylase